MPLTTLTALRNSFLCPNYYTFLKYLCFVPYLVLFQINCSQMCIIFMLHACNFIVMSQQTNEMYRVDSTSVSICIQKDSHVESFIFLIRIRSTVVLENILP